MVVTVFSLSAVGFVWYSLLWLSVLSNVFQIDGQEFLLYTLGISIWVSCMGPPCVRICDQTYIGQVSCYRPQTIVYVYSRTARVSRS